MSIKCCYRYEISIKPTMTTIEKYSYYTQWYVWCVSDTGYVWYALLCLSDIRR
jgi:hypothetical protein